ncbi:hypothetical protein GCM10017083_47980 [Thalassobaculum fulvum]|uniref:DUF1841 family protein n=1 Tax=Thalassobaculum fulvum TaxID=1633335 RepID=A0A918XX95_9PROT|nr:DUF1841 domain-containing protein [Thalassobaculum fulvum]GHD61074.1 hypothetical protein GCM10017083_47980 [Thalassobaculum fulvum]
MKRYDPNVAPDPEGWLALDEAKRLAMVADYHRQKRIRVPQRDLHAATHVIVENQAALGEELPVRRTIERLIGEGLDRHEAVHAVGCILMEQLSALMQDGSSAEFNTPLYCARLETLTVESWRSDFGEPD